MIATKFAFIASTVLSTLCSKVVSIPQAICSPIVANLSVANVQVSVCKQHEVALSALVCDVTLPTRR